MDIECEFFEDVRAYFVEALAAHRVSLPADDPARPLTTRAKAAAVEYFHLERRLILPRPRRVFWSRQLRARTLTKEHRLAVETIASELERGVNVWPRMTRSITKTVEETKRKDAKGRDTYDGLLADWGIHHLHIGSVVRADGLIEGRRELLFVFVQDDAAYLVELGGHGSSFTDQRLFDIVHENWLEARASWSLPGVKAMSRSPAIAPKDRRRLRGKVNVLTQAADGTMHVPHGGGTALSGHAVQAACRANGLLNQVRPAEDWIRENVDMIGSRIERLTGARAVNLHLRFQTGLTLALGRAVVWETATRAEIIPGGLEPIVGILGPRASGPTP